MHKIYIRGVSAFPVEFPAVSLPLRLAGHEGNTAIASASCISERTAAPLHVEVHRPGAVPQLSGRRH